MIEGNRILSCRNVKNAIDKRYGIKKEEKTSSSIGLDRLSKVSYAFKLLNWGVDSNDILDRPISAHVLKRILSSYEDNFLSNPYTTLEWIGRNSNYQHIDTGVKTSSNLIVKCDFATLSSMNGKQFNPFGSWAKGASKAFILVVKADLTGFATFYGSSKRTGGSPKVASKYLVEANVVNPSTGVREWKIDGKAIATYYDETFEDNRNFYLFTYNNITYPAYDGYGRIYACQMYNGDELIRDYIPVLNENDKPGLYDLVEKKFYTFDGADFDKGTVVSKTVKGYQQGEYVQFSGNSFINTGYYPKGSTEVEIKVDLEASTGYRAIFSGRTNNTVSSFTLFQQNMSTFRYDYGTTQTPIVVDKAYGMYTIRMGKGKFILNDITYANYTEKDFESKYMMRIGANWTDAISQNIWYMHGKIYYMKIYDNDILVRDFVPAKSKSGEIGFYDLVNHRFHPNAGSGNLSININE